MNSIKPKILIAGPKAKTEYYKPYMDAVRGAGGEPELGLPSVDAARDEKAIAAFLRPYRGILLPGGVDIEPCRYGEEPHRKLGPVDGELDEGQLAVVRYVLVHRFPTLAICRGMQVMGVAAGGSLFQDLPSQRPSNINHSIREPKDRLAHEAIVDAGSRLCRVSGSTLFQVNSRHHQALKLGEGDAGLGPFKIVARAPDGVVEGMEIQDHPFCVAVQWHPEDLFRAGDPQAQALFRAFIDASRT